MITRLAPTPSGFLHTGNIYNFLLNWLWARCNNGKVLLRIDDGDAERKRKEYVEDIFRVLDWLGLDWDTGPTGPDDFEKNWSQLLRKELYATTLKELAEKEILFACDCSRKQVCSCFNKNISLSTTETSWKIKVPAETDITFRDRALGEVTGLIASFIVRKKDGFHSYQLCSLVDDRHFNITHIGRGYDLKESTAMQLYIDNKLNDPYFNSCTFWHHPLLTSLQGEKFSKSAGTSGRSIIDELKKEELLTSFAKWLGIDTREKPTLQTLKRAEIFQTQ